MKKTLLILLMFVGLLGTTQTTQAQKSNNENWFKTLTKTETNFSAGIGTGVRTFDKTIKNGYLYDFMFDYRNIYLGFVYYYYSEHGIFSKKPTYSTFLYAGYGINIGNIYRIIIPPTDFNDKQKQNLDNIAHEIFKRITVVPIYQFYQNVDYDDATGVDKLKVHNITYLLDINFFTYGGWGLNYHYHNTVFSPDTKYHTLNINYNF